MSTGPQAGASVPQVRLDAAARYRTLLLALSVLTFLGIMLELWFADHTEGRLQLVPFATCAAAVLALAVVVVRPSTGSLSLARGVMLAAVLVGALGAYQHVAANYGFEREIRPNSGDFAVFRRALHGVAPALAPGSLALAAMLGLGAMYQYPSARP